MDPKDVKAAWERAARARRRGRRTPGARHGSRSCRDDMPTFMEAPAAAGPDDLRGADVAVLGIPYEGVKLLDPVTYAPALAAPAPEGSIYYRSGADEGPAAIRRHSVFYSLRHGRGLIPEVGRDLVILDHLRVVDYGDVDVEPGDVETHVPAAPTRSSPTSWPRAPCPSCSAATTPSRSRCFRCSPASCRQARRRRLRLALRPEFRAQVLGGLAVGPSLRARVSSSPPTSCRSASAACASLSATSTSPTSWGRSTSRWPTSTSGHRGRRAGGSRGRRRRHGGHLHLARHRCRGPGARRAEVPGSRRAERAGAAAGAADPERGAASPPSTSAVSPRATICRVT